MDGARASGARNRTWADVVNQNTAALSEAQSATQLSEISDGSDDSGRRIRPARDISELRYATPYARLPNTRWGVANNSILEDAHAGDANPFAGFPLEYLALKSDYAIRLGGQNPEVTHAVPIFSAAHPEFSAIFHLNTVLAETLDDDPTTALRETLGLAQGEYLVIPLDRALTDLDAEYVTRARFSLQHLAGIAQTGQYPIRFSLGGKVSPAGVTADRLEERQRARDQLNGFWITFSHYAESCGVEDKSAFIQAQMSALMTKYLAASQRPAVQESLGELARFFHAVFQTADFNETANRAVLLQQLMDIYTAAVGDEYLLETLAQEARENMTNCADRRALVLGDMEMAVLMHQSHGMGSEALFEAGLSIMRVHIADHHAFQSAHMGQQDETIEVLLRFRTALADQGLAVSGKTMAHEAVANVDQDEINRAARDIEAQTQDLSQVQAFFRNCGPWMEHVEALSANDVTALSEAAQDEMANIDENRHILSDQQYVQACDTLMNRWQSNKAQLLEHASDQLVASLHTAYWRQSD